MTAAGLDRMLANSKEVPRAPIEEMHRLIDYRLSLPSCVIQGDFDIVAKSHGEVWPKTPHSGLHIDQYLSAIPGEFWHSLLEIYARQDGSLSNGWPDLEITNGKEVMLVEVKVKDRLTPHQRLTIPVLMALGLKCRIVRLIKT
ncbi:VRR-NUC domain-containing protein [Azotobacter chroococcum]